MWSDEPVRYDYRNTWNMIVFPAMLAVAMAVVILVGLLTTFLPYLLMVPILAIASIIGMYWCLHSWIEVSPYEIVEHRPSGKVIRHNVDDIREVYIERLINPRKRFSYVRFADGWKTTFAMNINDFDGLANTLIELGPHARIIDRRI